MSLWDKVQRGVGRAAEEAEKQAAIAKLGLDINGINGEMRRKTAELGEHALKLARSGDLKHDTIDPLLADLYRLEARVSEHEKPIAEIRAAPAGAGD